MKNKKNKDKIKLNYNQTKVFSKAKDIFSYITNIPSYTIANNTKLTIINNNILIEGYKAVEEYYNHYIKIIAIDFNIIIDGENLDISEINDENIVISGNIASLNFNKK